LGAVPAPAGPAEPVIVDYVLEGSAADLAGVQPGDRILRLGQRSVASVYDYVVALRELSSMGEHSMIVERDGERVRIIVDPLAGRP
jgi:S1-C subfamily serine protease